MRTSQTIVVDPAIDTTAYTSGDCVGGLNTLRLRDNPPEAVLKSVRVIDTDNQKAPLTLLFFRALPAGAFTNNAANGLSAADALLLCGKANVAASDYETVNSHAVAEVEVSKLVTGLNDGSRALYMLVVTTGTPTYTANGNLRILLGLLPAAT